MSIEHMDVLHSLPPLWLPPPLLKTGRGGGSFNERKKMPTPAHPSGLSWKQRAFARYYVANGGDAEGALKSAGYAENTTRSYAAAMMQDPRMQKHLDELFEERIAPLEITFEKKLLHLKDIIIDALTGVYDKVRDKQNAQALAIKAIEVLNKMQGHNGDESTRVTINNLLESKEVKQLSQTVTEIKNYDKDY